MSYGLWLKENLARNAMANSAYEFNPLFVNFYKLQSKMRKREKDRRSDTFQFTSSTVMTSMA